MATLSQHKPRLPPNSFNKRVDNSWNPRHGGHRRVDTPRPDSNRLDFPLDPELGGSIVDLEELQRQWRHNTPSTPAPLANDAPYFPQPTNLYSPPTAPILPVAEIARPSVPLPHLVTVENFPEIVLQVILPDGRPVDLHHWLNESPWHSSESFCQQYDIPSEKVAKIASGLEELRAEYLEEQYQKLVDPLIYATTPTAKQEQAAPRAGVRLHYQHSRQSENAPTPQPRPGTPFPAIANPHHQKHPSNVFTPQTRVQTPSQITLEPHHSPERPVKKRSRKSRAGKSQSSKEDPIELPGPLSELALQANWQPRDMIAWVNRPLEARIKELKVCKETGRLKISRPSNNFVCYRMAYCEFAKQFTKQPNRPQQDVSRIMGYSWNGVPETKEIKDYYSMISALEAEAHKKAFPSWTYRPRQKPKQNGLKRGREEEDSDYYEEDGDYEQ